MNVLHMKYAVEVAKYGSINKAAQELYIAQPNLSRCIKELEADLGITIFNRTFRGMTLTPDGEEFISYAEKVLDEIDIIEKTFKSREDSQKQFFSISVPRASYISSAFCEFTEKIDSRPAEIRYFETDSTSAINNIIEKDFRLGIVRCNSDDEKYLNDVLDKKGLMGIEIAEFEPVVLFSKKSKLAGIKEIKKENLEDFIEILSDDVLVPQNAPSKMKQGTADNSKRKILIFDRGGQLDLLKANHKTYMFSSPLPKDVLKKFALSERKIAEENKKYKDILVRKKDYKLTSLDKDFIFELEVSKEQAQK